MHYMIRSALLASIFLFKGGFIFGTKPSKEESYIYSEFVKDFKLTYNEAQDKKSFIRQTANNLGINSGLLTKIINNSISFSPCVIASLRSQHPNYCNELLSRASSHNSSASGNNVLGTILTIRNDLIENKAPIMIPYRLDGGGKGALFDHFTLSRSTGFPTRVLINCPPISEQQISPDYLNLHMPELIQRIQDVQHAGYSFKHGVLCSSRQFQGFRVPAPATTDCNHGLLFLPGHMHDAEGKEPQRVAFQRELIRKALLRGQPILAVCGGAWLLWEKMGGKSEAAKDHCYNGGMPRLSSSHPGVVNNVQVHLVNVESGSFLQKIMGLNLYLMKESGKKEYLSTSNISGLPVNSVHWKAVDGSSAPSNFNISARSLGRYELRRRNCGSSQEEGSEFMNPAEGIAEAFESVYGAPILGIQWHPEAYNPNDPSRFNPNSHIKILKYMAEAGDTFAKKQRVLGELKSIQHSNLA